MGGRTVVWAPHASTVDLLVNDVRFPMELIDAQSFASAEVPSHGQNYGFSLNGSPVIPDPRSVWQPHGATGCLLAIGDLLPVSSTKHS